MDPGYVVDKIAPTSCRYQSVATESDYKIYAPNAEFEDPLMHAIGLKQVQSAFQAMPKTFSIAQALKSDVIKDLDTPSSGEVKSANGKSYVFSPYLSSPSSRLSRASMHQGQKTRGEKSLDIFSL